MLLYGYAEELFLFNAPHPNSFMPYASLAGRGLAGQSFSIFCAAAPTFFSLVEQH